MRDRLQRRNRDLLGDIEVLMRSGGKARIPETLQTYRVRLLTVCEKLRTLAQQNLSYLQIGQADILEDVLSNTQYTKRRFDLLSIHLAMPVLRATMNERLCLEIIAWQHRIHPQTASFRPVFSDGEWGIWPFREMGISLYYVPSVHQRGLRFLLLSFHETGHQLYLCHQKELDDLVAELQENVADMLRPLSQRNDRYAEDQAQHQQRIMNTWYAWAQELFCDAVGFTIGGPCYLYAFSHYLNMLQADDFYQQPHDLTLSTKGISIGQFLDFLHRPIQLRLDALHPTFMLLVGKGMRIASNHDVILRFGIGRHRNSLFGYSPQWLRQRGFGSLGGSIQLKVHFNSREDFEDTFIDSVGWLLLYRLPHEKGRIMRRARSAPMTFVTTTSGSIALPRMQDGHYTGL